MVSLRYFVILCAAIVVVALPCQHAAVAQEVGNAELRSAYEAALIRLMINGSYAAMFEDASPDTPMLSDCVPVASAYAYPTSPTVNGTLARTLQTGKLRIGAVDNDQWPLYRRISNSSEALEGLLPTLEAMVAELISGAYALSNPLSVEYHLYPTSSDLFTALANGEVDMTNGFMAVGTFFNGTSRRRVFFQPSCSIFARNRLGWTLTSSNIANITALRQTLTANTTTSVGVSGASNVAIMTTLFGQNRITGFSEDSDVISALLAENIIAAADIVVPSNAPYAGLLQSFNLGIASSSASFFRYDTPVYVEPPAMMPVAAPINYDEPKTVIIVVTVLMICAIIAAISAAICCRASRPEPLALKMDSPDA